MPIAQVIQLDNYRQPTPTPLPLSKKDRIRQLLEEATPITQKPEIIETRLCTIENKLSDVLNLLSKAGGHQ